MNKKATLQPLQMTTRFEDLAAKIGSPTIKRNLKTGRLQDLTDLKPEDILSFLHQGKLKQEDAMFWLGVLAVSAEEKAKKHEELATTDELTQVYNRRAFIDTLSKELSRLRSKHIQMQKMLSEPMSLNLMLLDIDFFKKVNDTYGHLSGDRVLKGLADVLKKQVRATDTVFRYGGEEFAILLPDTDEKLALEAAHRINKAVEKASFVINHSKKKRLNITVSVGLATLHGHQLANTQVTDMMIPRLIARSDAALYHSKEHGRNKVTVWTTKMKDTKKK
ncbi:MAG: GGDEF domain-containing protein [Patescibacteria group bacterium]